MPSHTHIKKMVENNVVSSVMLTREAIRKKKYIYICADKGNKTVNKNLPKFICWYDLDNEKVKILRSTAIVRMKSVKMSQERLP